MNGAEPRTGRPDAPSGASGKSSEARFASTLEAGMALMAALRHLAGALRTLAVAEGRLVLAGIPLFFIAVVALVALSVSLWVCLVALAGWALMRATHSLGIALGLLVVIHAILVVGIWSAIKYSLRQATFPQARAELGRLGRSLLSDFDRAKGVATAPDAASAARAANAAGEKDKT